jgi:hypothetical protein
VILVNQLPENCGCISKEAPNSPFRISEVGHLPEPYSARLSLMLVKTLEREVRLVGVTEKQLTNGVKLPRQPEP